MKKAPAVQGEGQTIPKGINMSNNIVPIGGSSPFDQIKRTRPDGTEYWSARDLMPLLAYPRWQYFRPVIDRAFSSAEAQGQDADTLFMVNHESPEGGGRPREDYRLTRFAAYLVAMNGDPRKPEVAQAQAYFAIKTREAEVTPQTQQVSSFDFMRQMLDQLEANDAAAREAQAGADKANARIDALEGRHDWYSALGFSRLRKLQDTSKRSMQRLGVKASAVARRNDIAPQKVPHELYGEVNLYPEWVWEKACDEMAASA